jgi:hypothetical protein
MFDKIKEMYDSAPAMSDWVGTHQPDSNLRYKDGVPHQQQMMCSLATIIRCDSPRVVSAHTSKSVQLPVATYQYTKKHIKGESQVYALIRDNFYCLNCAIVANFPVDLPLSLVLIEVTKEYLLKDKKAMVEYRKLDPKDIPDDNDWAWYYKYSRSKVEVENDRYYLNHYCFAEGMPFQFEPYTRGTSSFIFESAEYGHIAHVLTTLFKTM